MVKITIYEKECIGCAFCESVCPEIFHIEETENGFKAKLKTGELSDEQMKKAKEAAEGCPVQIIKLEE